MDFSFSQYRPYHEQVPLAGSPVELFEGLYPNEPWAFLYESLESPEKRGRYSFIGSKPFLRFQSTGERARMVTGKESVELSGNPFDALKQLVHCGIRPPDVFPFSGGAVGTVAYDAIRLIERLPNRRKNDSVEPDLDFLFPSELVAFDHLHQTADVIVYSERDGGVRVRQIVANMKSGVPAARGMRPTDSAAPVLIRSNFSKTSFCRAVEDAKAYILAGDIFQVVLSQRFSFPFASDPWMTYQRLRLTNPSPYMYYLRLGGRRVMGSSPEILVKLTGKTVVSRPLAGTGRRGSTEEEDRLFETRLVRDEKERAEHVMLVDLARNDIGRVCDYGSVRATGLFEVERYSKVMHLVSNVEGVLRQDKDAFDLFRACFPAGTVSGAPKIRAMEIIDELEPDDRELYAGSIGYFGFSGGMDMCIAIRMLTVRNGKGTVQAGAGIVADSDPEREYEESLNKARAVLAAADAEGGSR